MKKKIFTSYFVTAFLIASACLVTISCSKKLDEVYLNPNNPIVVPIEQLLPNVIANMTSTAAPPAGGGGGSYGPAVDGVLIGRYVQFWNWYTTSDVYDQMGGPAPGSTDNLGAVWAGHYYGIGQNAKRIIEWGTEQKKWDYVGVTYAIFAWSWLTLTEHHGEIIMREAFNTSLQQFKYDPQPDVYDTVRVICNQAIDYLSRTGDGVSQSNLALGDGYFYGGDVNKWKKFVYGILARSYAHLSNKNIYTANSYADSAIKYCKLSITTNADNATQKYMPAGTSGTQNFFGPFRQNMTSVRQSAFIVNLLNGVNTATPAVPTFFGIADPRTPYLVRENTNGTYRGVVPNLGASGLSANDQPRTFWNLPFTTITSPTVDTGGRYLFKNDAEFPIMTAAEIWFMRAEAHFRKGEKDAALAAYKEGINADFDMLTTKYNDRVPAAKQITLTANTKAAYMANIKVLPINSSELTLTHIMLQKYIAMYGYGTEETWTDMRRYHYTDIDPATGKQVYSDFTLPALYPQNNNKVVYRARPRYNSENLYNVPQLQSIGALDIDYNTKEQWFTQK